MPVWYTGCVSYSPTELRFGHNNTNDNPDVGLLCRYVR